jgi:senataxin
VRAALEASFVDDAEIVFTTLTSSSRKVFRQLTHGFDTVLIDEAAQANEMATLIPFLHGARRCVLVGDPQQLPSTVISKNAQQVSFQRSLFERFNELGAEALLLSVQYRMHPGIREFPSEEFYDGRLQDSASVLGRKQEPYQDPASGLGTYRIFDAHGLEERTVSNSVINHFEAILVVCMYKKIDKCLRDGTGETA